MPIVDPEAFEEDKTIFLGALYDLVTESTGHTNILRRGMLADQIAERCKFDKNRAQRAYMDLREEGLVKFWTVGPTIGLTKEGRDYIEAKRFEKSAKGRFRAVKKSATEKLKDGAAKLGIYLFGLATPALLSLGRRIVNAALNWPGLTGL